MSARNEQKRRKPEYVNSMLKRIISKLSLPDKESLRQTAAAIYQDASDKHLVRGISIEETATAALYSACRQCSVPISLIEISRTSGFSKRRIGRIYKHISQELGFKSIPASPIDYIPRLCSELCLFKSVQLKAIELLNRASEKGLLNGHAPAGMAAASVYMSSILCDTSRTQEQVALAAGVSTVTIRNRCHELNMKLSIGIPI